MTGTRQRLDILTREALGAPQKQQKNPEGVPDTDNKTEDR